MKHLMQVKQNKSLTWFPSEWCSNLCRAQNHRCRPLSHGLSCDKRSIRLIWCSDDWERHKNNKTDVEPFRLKLIRLTYSPMRFASSGCEFPWRRTMFEVAGQSIEKWFDNDFAGWSLKIPVKIQWWVAKDFSVFFSLVFVIDQTFLSVNGVQEWESDWFLVDIVSVGISYFNLD